MITVPKDLAKGQETAQWVLETVNADPDAHWQGSWEMHRHEHGLDCGTTRCVGGWALFAHGMDVSALRSWYDDRIMRIAAELLGLPPDADESVDAWRLFYSCDDKEAIRALEYLARGETIDWPAISPDFADLGEDDE